VTMRERACATYPPSPWLDYEESGPSRLERWAPHVYVVACLLDAVVLTVRALCVLPR
jgi:hypothetical protein